MTIIQTPGLLAFTEGDLARWLDQGQEALFTLTSAVTEPSAQAPQSVALAHLLESERLARRGDTDGGDRHYQAFLSTLGTIPERSPARRIIEARHLLIQARRAFRGGDATALKELLRLAQSRINRLPSTERSIRLALLELSSAVATSSGSYERAVRLLRQAEELARVEGDPWVGRIHRLLGAIHARCGRPLLAATAYQSAAATLTEQTAPLDLAKVLSNLAMVSLMAGQTEAARFSVERALQLRMAFNAPVAEIANSTAVLALVLDRREDPEAMSLWLKAVELCRQSPEPVLTAEIELRAAISAARRGDVAVSRELLEAATGRSTSLVRIQPTLVAMACEARARLALWEREFETARTEARKALQGYTSLDAVFHVARTEFLLGTIKHHMGREPQACQWLDSACRRALRGRFELGARSFELEPLRAAAFRGEQHVLRYCRTLGIQTDEAGGVVLVDRTGAIEAFGKRHEIGRQAIPFRIARHLCGAIPDGMTLNSLCQKLWPDEGYNPRTANRLRVHVHRLRELIGNENPCVLTESSTRGGVTTTRYVWNPDIPVRIVRSQGSAPRTQ
jgi:tetratricopeptide (TPR) repeat protein